MKTLHPSVGQGSAAISSKMAKIIFAVFILGVLATMLVNQAIQTTHAQVQVPDNIKALLWNSVWSENENYVFLRNGEKSVGIGIETPREKLEVAGNIRTQGNMNVDGDANILGDMYGRNLSTGSAQLTGHLDFYGDGTVRNITANGPICIGNC